VGKLHDVNRSAQHTNYSSAQPSISAVVSFPHPSYARGFWGTWLEYWPVTLGPLFVLRSAFSAGSGTLKAQHAKQGKLDAEWEAFESCMGKTQYKPKFTMLTLPVSHIDCSSILTLMPSLFSGPTRGYIQTWV